jgi:hypothetical protein
VSQTYISDWIHDDWDEFKCVRFEIQFPKVVELVKSLFQESEWFTKLIQIFHEIPYYEIDEEPKNTGTEWLLRMLNQPEDL